MLLVPAVGLLAGRADLDAAACEPHVLPPCGRRRREGGEVVLQRWVVLDDLVVGNVHASAFAGGRQDVDGHLVGREHGCEAKGAPRAVGPPAFAPRRLDMVA